MSPTLCRLQHLRGAKRLIAGAALLLLGTQVARAHSKHERGSIQESMPAMRHTGSFSFGAPGHPGAADRVVNITMNDLTFSPDTLTVKAGETIRFVVSNKSTIDHDFTLGDADAQSAHRREMAEMFEDGSHVHHHDEPNAVMVKPGEAAQLTWTFSAPGSLEFDCNIPGHAEAGMKGGITVTP